MSRIRGITVALYTRTQAGIDSFNRPIYSETPVEVENVLVTPATAEDVVNELSLSGKHLAYELSIPKGDTNDWEDKKVSFFGETFRTFGPVRQWIEEMVPLDWNKKIKVERYG